MRLNLSFLDPTVRAAVEIAVEAGVHITRGDFGMPNEGCDLPKVDPNVGDHAIATTADIKSQELIVGSLADQFPSARFIAEEEKTKTRKELFISEKELPLLGSIPLRFDVDPQDGSSQWRNGLWEWSISVGVVHHGQHVGGAIMAPHVLGGFLVFGERNKGVFSSENGMDSIPVRIGPPRGKNLVCIGPDINFLLNHFGPFLQVISQKARTTTCIGSCALGLAAVAAGKIDVLIQPVQCPWDWSAGYPLVEEAGGKMLFWHYRNGTPERILVPDAASYSSVERNIAFMAGYGPTVEECWDDLLANWH